MSFTPPPAAPPVTPDAPNRDDTDEMFDEKANALVAWYTPFVAWLTSFVAWAISFTGELNLAIASTAENVTSATEQAAIATSQADLAMGYRNTANSAAGTATTQAGVATTQAGIATTQAAIATTQAGLAATAKTNAETAKGLSEDARNAAEAFRDQAEIFATQQLVATSSTANTPGASAKTFTIETGRAFVPGMYLNASSVGSAGNRMSGYVTSHNASTGQLVIAVDNFAGSSSRSDWAIGVAAPIGAGLLGNLYRGAYLREGNGAALVTNSRYGIWTGGVAITMTMPTFANTAGGDEIVLGNLANTWGNTPFTINCPANVFFRLQSGAADTQLICDTNVVQVLRLFCVQNDGTNVTWAIS